MPLLFSLTVDGWHFDVATDPDQPGAAHITWIDGPTPGYGFTVGRTGGRLPTAVEAEAEIRLFLAAVDPTTGTL
jgi:hypothetical protein